MNRYTVEVTLYVEDDSPDGALATAKTILSDAGGSDTHPDAGDDYTTFGFALGDVADRDRVRLNSGDTHPHDPGMRRGAAL